MVGYMNNKAVQAVIGLGLLCFTASVAFAAKHDISKLPRVKQTLVAPPFVPEHDQVSKGPKVVEVTMETIEKQIEINLK